MSATLRAIRALGDATRLRILALVSRDELSVQELQEITHMGQSRISTHLGLLQEAGLVQSRRQGKRTFYKLSPSPNDVTKDFVRSALEGAKELPEHGADEVKRGHDAFGGEETIGDQADKKG